MTRSSTEYRRTLVFSTTDPYFTNDGVSIGYDLYTRRYSPNKTDTYQYQTDTTGAAVRFGFPITEYDTINTSLGVEQVKVKRREREAMVHSAMGEIKEHLDSMNITCEIQGRPKNFYSIHKKMLRDHKELSEIYDLLAIRVLVDSVKDCYGTLGVVHSMWRPIPGRFKDYVAVPKSNMYQSLHTTVLYGNGQPLEIQIRTFEMHRISEYGIAAHWRYKESGGSKPAPSAGGDKTFDAKLSWLRQLLEWHQDMSDSRDFVNTVKMDVFADEVFVFTPRGDVMKLPKGAVPLDFAYRIHTDVGHRCVGAKVNGKIVPLDYTLQNGDIVDIITSKNGKPSLDWLNIVGSTESRSKIRNWFKKENKEENVVKGRELLEKEAKRLNYDWKTLNKPGRLEQISKALNAGSETELMSAVGYGGIPVNSVLLRLIDMHKREQAKEDNRRDTMTMLEKLKVKEPVRKRSSTGILVKGEADVMVRMARCCNPVPGDEIVGYITRGRGVSVHRADCTNIGHTQEDMDRMIEVEWDVATNDNFHVAVEITAYDRGGMLMEIMATLSEMKINIVNINAKVDDTKNANITMVIEIRDLSQLDFVMTKVRRIKDVYSVQRANGGS